MALNSLRIQLLLWIALPVAVSLLGLSMVEIRGHEQAMAHMVQQQTDLVAHALGVLIDAHIDRRQSTLIQLAGRWTAAAAAEDTLPAVLADELPADTFAGGVAVWPGDPSTQPSWVASAPVAALAAQVARSQAVGLTTVYDEAGAAWLLVQAVPMPPEAAATVLLGADRVDDIAAIDLARTLDPALLDEVRLTTATGELLHLYTFDEAADAALHPGDHGASRWVSGETTILPTGWRVIVREDWRDLVPPLLNFGNVALMVVAVTVLLALFSAWHGFRTIVWPLRRLVEAAAQVGRGHRAAIQGTVGGVAEIEELRLALARMTGQIYQYQQELQSYIGAITLGQEEERRRLARELHDDTVQELVALNQQMELLEREVKRDPARAGARLQDLRPQVMAIIDSLRRQIHALRPLYLEDLGFVPALEMLVRQVSRRHDLDADFTAAGDPGTPIPFAVQTSIYRIVQEALQNVIRHAHAHQVQVQLDLQPDSLALRIVDDGRGFVVDGQPAHLAQEGHFGLLGMKERAQLHNGVLHIDSAPGQGTTILVRLPLPPAAHAEVTPASATLSPSPIP
jgi:signal transduction histidine kinase